MDELFVMQLMRENLFVSAISYTRDVKKNFEV